MKQVHMHESSGHRPVISSALLWAASAACIALKVLGSSTVDVAGADPGRVAVELSARGASSIDATEASEI